MNGELAQVIALIAYGNDFLSGSGREAPELFPSHSTFQYVLTLSFKRETTSLGVFRRTQILAADTRNWFTTLRQLGVKKLRLAFFPDGRRITQHVSPVFGQSGGADMWLRTQGRAISQYM